jgi:hypothetical protein
MSPERAPDLLLDPEEIADLTDEEAEQLADALNTLMDRARAARGLPPLADDE